MRRTSLLSVANDVSRHQNVVWIPWFPCSQLEPFNCGHTHQNEIQEMEPCQTHTHILRQMACSVEIVYGNVSLASEHRHSPRTGIYINNLNEEI